MAKYYTKESKGFIREKIKSIVELSVQAKHLATKGDSVVIIEHPLLSSTQLELRVSVSRGQVPVHSECWGSKG